MDLAGNRNTALFSRVFTTGPVLEDGSIAGTITGDANSTAAGDPTGAFVGAADAFPFAGGAFSVFGIATVAGNNTYQSKYLRDGTYYPLCVKETNNDGWLDPFLGDAVGFYGINFAAGDTVVATVDIIGGSHETGINFPIYDPTSVYGEVYYEGVHGGESHAIFIGLFAAAGFDPNNPGTPVAATEAYWPEPTVCWPSIFWY